MGSGNSKPVISPEDYSRRLASLSTGSYSQADSLHPRRQSQVDQDHVRGAEGDDHHLPRSRTSHDPNEMSSSFTPGRRERRRDRGHGEPMMDATIPSTSTSVPPHALSDRISGPPSPAKPSQPQPPADEPPQERRRSKKKKAEEPPSRHSPENLARAESTDGPPPIAETKTRRLKRDTDSVEAPSTARPSTVTTAPPSTSAEALPPPVKESELIAAAPPATRQSTPPMAPPPLPPAAPLTSSPSISASPKKVPKKKPTAETEPQRLEPRPPQVTPAAAQATQTDSEKKKSVESTATQTEKRRHHRHREQGASDSETATTTSTASAPSVPETHHKRAIATDGESYPSFGAGGGASKSQFRTPRSTPTPNRSGKPIVVKQPSVILPVIDTRSRQPEESLMKEVPRAPSRTTATSSHRSSHSSSTRYRPPSHPPLHIHKRVDGEEVPVDVTESETEGNPITDSGSSRMKQSTEADRSNDDPLHHLIYNLAMQVVNLGDGKSATPTPSESSRGAKSNDLGTKALTTSSNPTVMVHLSMDEVNALRSLCNGEELSATPRGGRPIPNSARVPKSSPRKVEEKDDVVQKEEVESNNTVSSYTTATASVFSTDPIRVYPLRRRRPGEERKKKDESKPPLHPATVHISHAPPTDVIHPTRRSTREPTPAEEEEDIEVSRRDSAMEKLREAVLSAMEDPIPDELHSSILEQPHHVAQEQAAPAPVTESRHAEPRKEPLQLHQSKASSRATPVLTAPVSVTNNGKEFVFELRLTMHADSDTPTVEWVMKRPFKPDVGERVTADSTKSEPLMMPARAPSVVPSIESSVLDTNAGEEVAPVKPVCTSRKSSLLPPRLSYTRRSMESSLLETKDVHQPISSECASPVAVALPPRGVYEVQPVDGCLRDNGESTEAPKEILPPLAAVTPSEGEPEAGVITINMSPSPSQQHGPIHVTNPLGNAMQDNENALYQQGVVLLVNDDAQDGMSPRNTERSAFHSAVDGDDLFGPSSYAIIDDVDGENVTLVLVSEVQDGIHAAGESAADNMSAHSEVSGQDGNEERDFLHGSPQQIITDATGAISRVLSLATGMTTLLESWVLLVPHINEFGKDVYSRLLQRHPEFASLFITTDMTTQPGKLMTMIGRAVVRFSQPSLHMQLLTETGARHCMYGVDEQHAAVMARAFMAILPKYVSPKVYRRSKDVWRLFWGTAVQLLANGSRSERGNLYRRRYWEIWCGRVQKVMAVLVEKQMGNIEVDQKHHFFSKVFQRATERHPDLSSFQNRTERATDRAMDAFITMVKCLNDTTVVDNYLVELGQKHQEYGVTPDVLNKYRQPFLDVCAEYLEGNPVWDPVGQLSMAQMWDYIAKVWGQCNRASFHDETQEVKNLSAPDGNEPFCLIFTDVEASTKLWDRHPDLMSAAVQQHHRMIRSIIADYNGYEVKTVGDSFLIATKDALSALKIALAIQLDFMRGPIAKGFKMVELTQGGGDPKCWRDDSFRIRIGIHYCTDSTAVYDTVHQRYDYYGPDVNCAARVEAAASGGQILMTKATLFALHDIPEFTTAPRPRVLASTSTAPTTGEESQRPLSSYVTFIDEGSVPMKGISHPVTLIAVVHEVLAGRTFPVKASQRASQFHRKSAAEAILGIA